MRDLEKVRKLNLEMEKLNNELKSATKTSEELQELSKNEIIDTLCTMLNLQSKISVVKDKIITELL